jgi:hypothetical protein
MADNGTENSGQITAAKTDQRLSALSILLFLLRKVVIDGLDDGFKASELHHGVWDLSSPQRNHSLIQSAPPLLLDYRIDPLECTRKRGRDRSLDPHLDRFKWTQRDIGQKLGGRRAGEVDGGSVFLCVLGPGEIAIVFLEELVAAVFEGALGGVAEEGGRPPCEDAAEPLGTRDCCPRLEVAFVETRVYLAPAFDEVEGCDGGVCEAL